MSSFKAVAFDLDDTLLHHDLTISDYTISVFTRLRNQGFRFIAASGRANLSMKPFVRQLGCISLYIACNGAEIWDPVSDTLLHQEMFSRELALEIAEFGVSHDNCYAQTYGGDRFYFNQHSVYADRYAAASMLKGEYVGDLRSYIKEPRNKILMMAEEDHIARMLLEARKLFEGRVSVTCSKAYFLEFNPIHATKGIALEKAARRLSLSPKEIIAFGDSLNDLSMLQAAGRSVVVANGRPDILPLCDDICLSNEEDGVADYLEKHFLGKEVPV